MKEKANMYLPPWFIDMHCHPRDFNQSHITTIDKTIAEAKSGLIYTSAFMPNTDPPITTCSNLDLMLDYIYRATAKHDVREPQFVWFGATDTNNVERVNALRYPNVIGIKGYPKSREGKGVTTGTIGISEDSVIREVIEETANVGKVAAFHCDDPEIIALEGYTKEAVLSYVEKVIRIAFTVPGAKIMVCHVPCREAAQIVLEARCNGLDIILELCPHYLWFDAEGTNWNPELDPIFYHCYNNLFTSQDREYLVSLLSESDAFVCIGSDNAPWTREEKLKNKKGGLPTNQHMVSVILTLSVKHGIPSNRIADLLCYNAGRFFGIPVPAEKTCFILTEESDNRRYNDGLVESPWRGSKLFVPSSWC